VPDGLTDISAFEQLESNVRYYCRRWPAVFVAGRGAHVVAETGQRYLDFFSGAGALSYGHNPGFLVEAVIEHLRAGRLVHSLDTHTPEKAGFLRTLERCVLEPRQLDMVVQFVGPTGATAVEAALRLAERVSGRRAVVAFEGGFHGMTAGAARVSHSLPARDHTGCRFLPYRAEPDHEDLVLVARALATPIDGELPGAMIVEPVQGEGGARPFDRRYLGELRRLCTEHGVVLIADEIQAGVGRTGPFFSFEGSQLDPDIICLSKSLSGLGLPFALNLIRRSLDRWSPGEFTGTFRGSNLAFVSAAALLEHYWSQPDGALETARHGELVEEALTQLAGTSRVPFSITGRGLLWGLTFDDERAATAVVSAAFRSGLIVEACGERDRTVKLLPPLVIRHDELVEGLEILSRAVLGLSEAD